MTSRISTTGIDANFPVQGRDNSSQGFRNNFTNIKTGLNTANTEIADLNDKAVLKAALGTDAAARPDNDMGGNVISNVEFKQEARTKHIITSSGSINYAEGGYQTLTTTGAVTLSFSGWPATGKYAELDVMINIANVSHTVTLPASVTKKAGTITGLTTRIFTAPTTGEYLFKFTTDDAGTTVTVQMLPITAI